MNIKGSNIDEISNMLLPYIRGYFAAETLKLNGNIFVESFLFEFDEIKHIIPEKHHSMFCSSDKLNGACGIIEVDSKGLNVYLISSEDYSNALILATQEADTGKITLLKDFIQLELKMQIL